MSFQMVQIIGHILPASYMVLLSFTACKMPPFVEAMSVSLSVFDPESPINV